MRHLIIKFFVVNALFFGMTTISLALPNCVGSETSDWNNCIGIKNYTDGRKYVGEWKDGKYHGQGTITSADGIKYVGEWKDGKINGQGTFTYANGKKYVGEWKDNKYNGQGAITFADGNKYVGEWQNHKYNGQGTFTNVDGRKYVGEWKDNKFNGQGTFTNANGRKYVGEWKDGKKNGQGILTFANGKKYVGYVGEWKDDKLNGQGTFTFSDGRIYTGEWKNSKQHGQGTLIESNGSTTTGNWSENEFVAANSETKSVKITKNYDNDYVTVSLPQGIQFPVPKTWQNMTPLKGILNDQLNKVFDQNYDVADRLGFVAKGFDKKGNMIGQVSLTFLKNETFGQEAFSQASDKDFEQLAKQIERLNRKGAKLAGAEYLDYKTDRLKINGHHYHRIVSERRNQNHKGELERFFVLNLRYYDFENSYSFFISFPISLYSEMKVVAKKINAEIYNYPSIDEIAKNVVRQIEPRLPLKTDELTTWEGIHHNGGIVFFRYKIHLKKENIDMVNFPKKLEELLRLKLCQNQENLSHFRSGASYHYNYKSDDNLELANFYFDNKYCNFNHF